MAAPSGRKRGAIFVELALLLLSILLAWGLKETQLAQILELGTYDSRLVLRTAQPVHPDIVFLDIDDSSLLKFGRWPWPRSHYGEIISVLRQFGARQVLLDIEFPEKSQQTLKKSLKGQEIFENLTEYKESELETLSNYTSNLFREVLRAIQDVVKAGTLGELDPEELRKIVESSRDVRELVEATAVLEEKKLDQFSEGIRAAVENPDMKFAQSVWRADRVYGVFFMQRALARRDAEIARWKEEFRQILARSPYTRYDSLPPKMRRRPGVEEIFNSIRLEDYLSKEIDATPEMAAETLGLPVDWVSERIESDRQVLLFRAVEKVVTRSNEPTLEEVLKEVEERFHIADMSKHQAFLEKSFTKALGKELVRRKVSLPDFEARADMDIFSTDDFQPPIPLFSKYYRGMGFSNYVPDLDGSLRAIPLFWKVKDRIYLHVAFQMACDLLGVKPEEISFTEKSEVVLQPSKGSPRAIPVDDRGRMLVNWAGPWKTFPHRSLDGVRDYLNLRTDYRARLKRVDMTRSYRLVEDSDILRQQLSELAADLTFVRNHAAEDRVIHVLETHSDQLHHCLELASKDMSLTGSDVTQFLTTASASVDLALRTTSPAERRKIASRLEKAFLTKAGELAKRVGALEDDMLRRTSLALEETVKRQVERTRGKVERLERELQALQSAPPGEDRAGKEERLAKKLEKRKKRLEQMQVLQREKLAELADVKEWRNALKKRENSLRRVVEGKVCIIGSVASGTVDLGKIPYEKVYPQVGVHGNALNTLLLGRFIKRLGEAPSALILVAIGLSSGLIFPRVAILSGLVLLVQMLAAYLLIAFVMLQTYGLWIPVVPPMTAILLNYMFISVYRYVTEQRKRREVQKVFAQFLSPEVINDLLQDPDNIKLGGDPVIITPFFSDVAGFSTISENLTATQLVELLNEYLGRMTDILLEYRGTLDKYEGDAVIAFFGAPQKYDDHAAQACLASLAMQDELAELRKRWRKEGKPQMRARIGLSTGPAVVGLMGSEGRKNYTMMGDTVNLAARLEGANKPYGTVIMVPQTTYEAAKDVIEARVMDRIRVVGKLEPILVYEVMARKGELPAKKAAIVELYSQGMDYYTQRKWEKAAEYFTKADELPGGDTVSKVYVERCKEFLAFPPPDDWDGVYVLKEK